MSNQVKIGERLRRLREEHSLTQKELASKLNISQQGYAAYERDTSVPSLTMLLDLSKHYNVSIDYILGNTEDLKLGEADDSYSAGQVNLDPEDLISRFLRLSRQDKITISSIVNYLLYYHSTRKD